VLFLFLVGSLSHSSHLKVEAVYSSETSVTLYRPAHRHVPEDCTLQVRYNWGTFFNNFPVEISTGFVLVWLYNRVALRVVPLHQEKGNVYLTKIIKLIGKSPEKRLTRCIGTSDTLWRPRHELSFVLLVARNSFEVQKPNKCNFFQIFILGFDSAHLYRHTVWVNYKTVIKSNRRFNEEMIIQPTIVWP
jgi:hypothetical protein